MHQLLALQFIDLSSAWCAMSATHYASPWFSTAKDSINLQIFLFKKIKTLIDQREYANITITESVLYKKTLDGFRTCDINEDKENMYS